MTAVIIVAVIMLEHRALVRSFYREVDTNGVAFGPILGEPWAIKTAILVPAIVSLLSLNFVIRKVVRHQPPAGRAGSEPQPNQSFNKTA